MYDEDYNINARLGLTILIYYTGGGSVAGQRKTLEAAERFYSKYHGYLKMHFGQTCAVLHGSIRPHFKTK